MTYNQIYVPWRFWHRFRCHSRAQDLLTTTSIHFLFAISGHIFKQITHRSMKLAAHADWESWLYEAQG